MFFLLFTTVTLPRSFWLFLASVSSEDKMAFFLSSYQPILLFFKQSTDFISYIYITRNDGRSVKCCNTVTPAWSSNLKLSVFGLKKKTSHLGCNWSTIQDILKFIPFINKCKISFSPHITSIYILYKANFMFWLTHGAVKCLHHQLRLLINQLSVLHVTNRPPSGSLKG